MESNKMKKYSNGKLVELTSDEIAEHNTLCNEAAAYEKEFREKINRKKEKKESALQKFKEIGIDKEELISLGFFNET
tara:strand:- start:43 stop:273 length:231 start_codon:yes stop_codon:yes gene_type:complete